MVHVDSSLRPHNAVTGIGGDAFALYFEPKAKRVHCIMGNGRSPAALTLDWVHAQGVTGHELPPFHAMTATVPGAAALWDDAVSQWGRLRLEQVGCGCAVLGG